MFAFKGSSHPTVFSASTGTLSRESFRQLICILVRHLSPPPLPPLLLSVSVSVCVCVSLSLSVSLSLPVCLCLSPSMSVCLYLPACLSVCLPACLPACLSVCLSVCVCVFDGLLATERANSCPTVPVRNHNRLNNQSRV